MAWCRCIHSPGSCQGVDALEEVCPPATAAVQSQEPSRFELVAGEEGIAAGQEVTISYGSWPSGAWPVSQSGRVEAGVRRCAGGCWCMCSAVPVSLCAPAAHQSRLPHLLLLCCAAGADVLLLFFGFAPSFNPHDSGAATQEQPAMATAGMGLLHVGRPGAVMGPDLFRMCVACSSCPPQRCCSTTSSTWPPSSKG